jgi:hypothetical protein
MFDDTSRYHSVETARTTLPDGRVVAYKRRRFLPAGADMPLLTEVTMRDGDRLDLIAAAHLGDPLQFWRLCDANDAMHPGDLESEPGRSLRVPIPQP